MDKKKKMIAHKAVRSCGKGGCGKGGPGALDALSGGLSGVKRDLNWAKTQPAVGAAADDAKRLTLLRRITPAKKQQLQAQKDDISKRYQNVKNYGIGWGEPTK